MDPLPVAPLLGPVMAITRPVRPELPYSIPVGTVLLYENFSRYREGAATDWGPNTTAKTGPDGHRWLAAFLEGTYPVGRNIRLPNEFYWECRYAVNTPEVTRGVLGWWKEPLANRISFVGNRGARYAIDWTIRCGVDLTWRDPLGAIHARRYYHTVQLPSGAANEVAVAQPTGMLRITRDKNIINVFLEGQLVAAGTIDPMGQLVGFEVNVTNAKNGMLLFTDFKIGR